MNIVKTQPLYITRFIAAYMILIFHYIPFPYKLHYPFFYNLSEPVNYFFFISGFVMIISNEKYLKEAKPRVPAKSFWIKRWARIYPLYFFALAACIAFNYLVQKSIPAIPSRVGFEIIGIQRWLYGGSINFPAWSVSCEFFFYFLFPFSIPWIFKYSFNKLLLLVIVYFLITLFCNYYIFKYIPGKPPGTFINYIKNAIYFHPVFKYSIFLFGNWCGLFYLKNAYKIDAAPQYLIRIVCLFSAILIAAAIYFIPPGNFYLDAGILCPLYAIFIWSLCSFKGRLLSFFSNPVFIFLGDISYGIYILQAPLYLFYAYFIFRNKTINTLNGFLEYTVALIIVSGILFHFFETPVKKWILKLYYRQ